MRPLRIVPVVLLAAAVTLTACSSSESGTGSRATGSGGGGGASSTSSQASKPADAADFVSSSFDAFAAADTAHVAGTFVDAGDDGQTLDIDISYGEDVAIGTLAIDGQEVEISRTSDGTNYLKGSAEFYRSVGAPEDTVAVIADKYVEVTEDNSGFDDFVTLLDKGEFADQFRPDDSDLEGADITGPTDVNGVSCYGIEDSDGQGAFYAAAEGDPLPVQLRSAGDGELNFDKYGEPVDVPTPAPGDIVQLPS